MKKRLFLCLTLLCVLLMAITGTASAAKKGSLQPVDFTFKEVALGDTSEVMQEKLGEPQFDTNIIVLSNTVKCYVYSSDLRVCVDPRTEKVVAILCKDKEYQGRDGVTYGSTKAKLVQVYGSSDRERYDGVIYTVYRNPEDKRQKLMLEMEPDNYYVESWLITSLPLTELEQAEYDMGEFPVPDEDAEEADMGGNKGAWGVSSNGQWWTTYKVSDNVKIGIGN